MYKTKEYGKREELYLYDFGAREYDPQIGRFLSKDAFNQFNSSYTGMGNNPVSLIDPTGNESEDITSPGTGKLYWDGYGLFFYANSGQWLKLSLPASYYDASGKLGEYGGGPDPDPGGGGTNPPFPLFATILSNYPLPYSYRPDRTPIDRTQPLDDEGGGNFKYYNQCAIRVSLALRNSGVSLNGAINQTNPGHSAYGNNNIIGAKNLACFLRDNYLGKLRKA